MQDDPSNWMIPVAGHAVGTLIRSLSAGYAVAQWGMPHNEHYVKLALFSLVSGL